MFLTKKACLIVYNIKFSLYSDRYTNKLMELDKISNSVNNYEFVDSLDLFVAICALSNIKRYDDAIKLYEKFKTKIKESGNEIVGLITTIGICQEKKDCLQFEYYVCKLKIIAPDHSFFSAVEMLKVSILK
jgi:hypothetical protein